LRWGKAFALDKLQSNLLAAEHGPVRRSSITVCRFLCLRGRGCVYAETCVYARGYVYAPAVYTYYRSRKRTYPRIRTRVRVRTRCVNAPSARVYTPTRVYAPGCVYAPAAYTHPPLA
jgi:hypothetical protein